MSRDLESQLAAFARALDSRSQRTGHTEASPEPPRPRAGVGALALAALAAVVLVVLPVVFFSPPATVSPSSTIPPATTVPPTTLVPTTELGPSVIPSEGWATLGSSGITASDGSVIWAGEGSGRGRLVRDGAGGLAFTDSEDLWWMSADMTEPRLVAEVSGELIEVIPTPAGPVARIGSCPSTFVHLTDGSQAPERQGRINVNCESGDWGQVGRYDLYEDPDGLIWLHVIEFDSTIAWLPFGGPSYPSVRVEDFDGGRVLLSRRQGDFDDPPDELWLVDLHDVSVVEIPVNRDEHTGAALLGPDSEDQPDAWEPSWIGEPPHSPGMTDFFDRLPLSLRSNPLWQFESEEGAWTLSRPTDGLLNLSRAWGCGVPDTDWCTYEYGEILLVSEGGLEFAVPTPGLPSTWLAVRDDYVYAGRIGDGALPDSSLIRIDRATHEVVPIVFRVDVDRGHIWPQGGPIFVNPADPMWERFEAAVSLAPARSEPVDGTTPVWVDFEAVDALIEDLIVERTVVD